MATWHGAAREAPPTAPPPHRRRRRPRRRAVRPAKVHAPVRAAPPAGRAASAGRVPGRWRRHSRASAAPHPPPRRRAGSQGRAGTSARRCLWPTPERSTASAVSVVGPVPRRAIPVWGAERRRRAPAPWRRRPSPEASLRRGRRQLRRRASARQGRSGGRVSWKTKATGVGKWPAGAMRSRRLGKQPPRLALWRARAAEGAWA